MTISRIFSSFYNLYSQTEAPVEAAKIEVPIQEEASKESQSSHLELSKRG